MVLVQIVSIWLYEVEKKLYCTATAQIVLP
jgi:hypothetical protein